MTTATRKFVIAHDHSVMTGGPDAGNAADQHSPVGLWTGAGNTTRQLLTFTLNFADITAITSAKLYLRSTNGGVHTGFGSSPTMLAQRIVGAWEPGLGGGEGIWSTSATPKGSTMPGRTGAGEATGSMTRSHNVWDTIDITAIVQAWFTGSVNHGVSIRANNETSTADTWEFYSKDSSYDPYILVTYTPVSTDQPPSVAQSAPLTGDVAEMVFEPGQDWSSPRPLLSWDYDDPENTAQSAWQVQVFDDSAGSPGALRYDSGKVAGTETSVAPEVISPNAFVEGNYYHWQVRVWDALDTDSGYPPAQRFRTRWGVSSHRFDMGAAPSQWSITGLFSTGPVVIEYNSADDGSDTNLGTWMADLAPVAKRRWFRYRVWLLGGGATPAFDEVILVYSATTPGIDTWTLSAGAAADVATLVYGSQSLRIDGAGTDRRTWQQVTVLPNTRYWLSGRMKMNGAAGAFMAISDAPTSGGLAAVSAFGPDWAAYEVSWDSGSNTQVYVQCAVTGLAGTSAWFDALKLEAAIVSSAWTPGFVGAAAAVDAMGVQVDGSAGGVFRLKGSGGTATDLVEMGLHGLRLGGAGEFTMGTSMPTSPASGDVCHRTDHRETYQWDGTRWLSLQRNRTMLPPKTSFPHGFTTTTSRLSQLIGPATLGYDVYAEGFIVSYLVLGGGTGLSGSHKWVGTLDKRVTADTASTIATVTINNGSSGVWRSDTQVINAVVDQTIFMFDTTWTKTGTPGALNVVEMVTWRRIGT